MLNTESAILTSFRPKPSRHIKNAATPIKKYNVVQTGPNIQAGGLKTGFVSVAYHVLIAEIVNSDPIMPANSETTTAIINFNKLFLDIE